MWLYVPNCDPASTSSPSAPGGGGLDLGVGLALPGARVVCVVEREAFAVAHLVAAMRAGLLHPAPVWSDARTFDGRRWRGSLDGLIGGIPCQPHSHAGLRLAELDERDLWSPTRRIIVQARVWFVLIENVGGMLSSGGAERLWRELGRLGFRREIGLFAASEVGASHERERLFVLGVHDDLADARSPRFQGRELSGASRSLDGFTSSRPAAELCSAPLGHAAIGNGAGVGESQTHPWSTREREHRGSGRGLFPPAPDDRAGWRDVLARTPELEPALRRMADGVAARLDAARAERLRMLGNGVVPLQAAYALRTLAARLARRGSSGADRLVRMMADE